MTDTEGKIEVAEVGVAGVTMTRSFDYNTWTALGGSAAYADNMVAQTFEKLTEFPQRIPAVAEAIFGGERDPETPISVIGASRIGGGAAEAGLWRLFPLMLAGLNVFMGVFNLLPLLPLDGGHIAVVLVRAIRDWLYGRRGKTAAAPVDYTGLSGITMALIMIGGAVLLLTVTADIVNPVRTTQ